MLKTYRADLHIHTCLSPCGDLTMSPKRVVERAVEKGIDMIGICDHNSAENVGAAVAAAKGKNITVLPGMEITSIEEVHVIGLFEEVEQALRLQETVYKHLPPGENREEIFGEQITANERDEVEGFNKRLLSSAVDMTLKEIVEEIHDLGGLAVAAHIDREVYSIMGQLGFIPDDLELDALEITGNTTPARACELFPGIEGFSLITSSDAHYLDDIGTSVSTFLMERPCLDELRAVFLKKNGRAIVRED